MTSEGGAKRPTDAGDLGLDRAALAVAALTIAGSDSGGGAGIQADLRTFFAHGLLGCSAITAITAQNTLGVRAFEATTPALVAAQIDAVLDDLPIGAAKTGMLATAAVIEAVVTALTRSPALPLVVDPVMVSTSGHRLIADDAVEVLTRRLLPRADVLTPNLAEAAVLLEIDRVDDPERALEGLARLAPRAAIVLKGGHSADPLRSDDLVRFADGTTTTLSAPRVATRATHGTGCTLSAAIAASMALGAPVADALVSARAYLAGALAHAVPIGAGHGPVNHLWRLQR